MLMAFRTIRLEALDVFVTLDRIIGGQAMIGQG